MKNNILKLLRIMSVCMVCMRTEAKMCVQRVYIDKSYNQSCTLVPETANDWQCESLDNAFQELKNINSTCIYLRSNTTLHNTRTLEYVHSLSISSITNDSWSSITCKKISSLKFKYCSNIRLSQMILRDCGDLSEIDWIDESNGISERKSINVSAAITFEHCSTINFSDVKLLSSYGYGLLFKDSNSVTVNHSSIVDSRYTRVRYEDETFEMGGGIFVYYQDSDAGNNNNFSICDSYITTSKSLPELNGVSPPPDHLPYGKGGGIYFSVAPRISGNSIQIEQTNITNNLANNGAGIFVSFLQHSSYNEVILQGCTIAENIAKEIGGGAYVQIYSENNNSFIITRSQIEGNQANVGGGITLLDMVPKSPSTGSIGNYHLHELRLNNNTAQIGTTMYAQNVIVSLRNFQVSFSNVRSIDHFPGHGAVYALRSILLFHGNHNMFCANNNSAIILDSSKMYAYGRIKFLQNVGYNGGALAFYERSTLYLTDNTNLFFKQNKAWNKGGAIYAQMPGPSLQPWDSTELNIYDCFIKFIDTDANTFNGNFTFLDNECTDGDSHDIFASSLQSCRRYSDLDRFQIIAHWHNFKFENDTPAISTNAITMEELNIKEWTSYPGDLLNPHIILKDERNNNISESINVIASPPSVANIETNRAFVVDTDESIKLTLLNNSDDRSKIFHINVKTTTNIFLERNLSQVKFLPCPFGFTQSDGSPTCECNILENEDLNIALCDDKSIYLFRNIWVDRKEKQTYICPPGSCLKIPKSDENRYILYNKTFQCAENRVQTSRLCSKCLPGYSAVSSKPTCERCPKDSIGWIWVTLVMVVAISVLIGLVMVANIDIMSYNLNICLYSYQIIDLLYTYEQKLDPFLSFIMSIFQLTPKNSMYPSVCLWYGMDSLDKIAMEYCIPTWMLIFMAILYFYVQKKELWMERWYKTVSIVLIMCFSYFIRLSFMLLHPVEIDGTFYVYQYADVEYFSSRHIGYGIMALIVLIFIGVFSIAQILLVSKSDVVVFEWLFRFENKLCLHFKPSHRWFWIYYFVCRLAIYIFGIFLTNFYRTKMALLVMLCFAICIIVSRLCPYKDETTNLVEIFVLLTLTAIGILSMGIRSVFLNHQQESLELAVHILSYIPLVVVLFSFIKHFYDKTNRVQELHRRVSFPTRVTGIHSSDEHHPYYGISDNEI